MSVHRHPRKPLVLLLLLAAIAVVGPRLGGSVAAGAYGQPAAAAGNGDGNPQAVPPILPRVMPSELAVIRRFEAREAVASAYHLPASARYSLAELDAYASASR